VAEQGEDLSAVPADRGRWPVAPQSHGPSRAAPADRQPSITLTLVAVMPSAHRRFGPSSVGHDLGTDRAMPASAVHPPLEPAHDHSAASA
jgi:hypothetical protein